MVSIETSQGSCVLESGTVICDLGDLGRGSLATVAMVVAVNIAVGEGETGQIVNTVSVAGG